MRLPSFVSSTVDANGNPVVFTFSPVTLERCPIVTRASRQLTRARVSVAMAYESLANVEARLVAFQGAAQ